MRQSGEHTQVVPTPHTSHKAQVSRRLQFLQLSEDQDGQGITLILYTVEVPQTSRVSHGESRQTLLPTPDNWIAFQI